RSGEDGGGVGNRSAFSRAVQRSALGFTVDAWLPNAERSTLSAQRFPHFAGLLASAALHPGESCFSCCFRQSANAPAPAGMPSHSALTSPMHASAHGFDCRCQRRVVGACLISLSASLHGCESDVLCSCRQAKTGPPRGWTPLHSFWTPRERTPGGRAAAGAMDISNSAAPVVTASALA